MWWIIFIISLVSYALLAGYVFPKKLLKTAFQIPASFDRGLKNYKEKNGRSIVYETQPDYEKYISRYIISERNGKKVMICKPNEKIAYLDYDVVLFNNENKVFQVLNVKENITKPGFLKTVELPSQTSYATLLVNSVDNISVKKDVKGKICRRSLARFILITSFLIILEVFCAQLCLANIFGGVYAETFATTLQGFFVTFLIGIAAVLVNLTAVLIYAKIRNKSKKDIQNRK